MQPMGDWLAHRAALVRMFLAELLAIVVLVAIVPNYQRIGTLASRYTHRERAASARESGVEAAPSCVSVSAAALERRRTPPCLASVALAFGPRICCA